MYNKIRALDGGVKRVVMSQVVKVLSTDNIPAENGWLSRQSAVVIAVGDEVSNADVVLDTDDKLPTLLQRIHQFPRSSLVLVQALRAIEQLPVNDALMVESFCYATLQAGSEHQQWLLKQVRKPTLIKGEGFACHVDREGDELIVQLDRPQFRNAITVEMRDALMLVLDILEGDASISTLKLSGRGPCFSVGGALEEFGLSTDVAEAHWVRSIHSAAVRLAAFSGRVHTHVHGACIGSGIELPAFSGRLVASPRSFFQLPELNLGLIPGAGGCVSISRRIGRQRLAWWVLSGKKINAQTALTWGLVDAIEERQADR